MGTCDTTASSQHWFFQFSGQAYSGRNAHSIGNSNGQYLSFGGEIYLEYYTGYPLVVLGGGNGNLNSNLWW